MRAARSASSHDLSKRAMRAVHLLRQLGRVTMRGLPLPLDTPHVCSRAFSPPSWSLTKPLQPRHARRHITQASFPAAAAGTTQTGAVAPAISPVAPDFPGEDTLPYYSQYPLDRLAYIRRDTERLSELWASDTAVLVPLARDKVLVQRTSPTTVAPVLLRPAAAYATDAQQAASAIFLGVDATGAPYFAIDAAADPTPIIEQARVATEDADVQWVNARVAGAELSPGDAALLAVASGLAQWHATSSYDPATGQALLSTQGGHARNTGQPRARSAYPRIDPAVIMLVTAGRAADAAPRGAPVSAPHWANEWCLLGRKAEWPEGRYSTLAGFMEVGEPLELAVARETYEESGITVQLPTVTYAASQPWPFPRSLMVGFYATAAPANQQRPPISSMRHNKDHTNTDNTSNASPSQASTNGAGGPAKDSKQHVGVFQGVDGAPAPTPDAAWTPPAGARGYDLLPTEGRRAAIDVGLRPHEVEQVLLPVLPQVHVDIKELEDCRWFHRDWLRARLLSTQGDSLPGAGSFQIPGRWSLAYRLITTWLHQGNQPPLHAPSSTQGGGSAGAGHEWVGYAIPQVALDEGVFKYVLMRLRNPNDPDGPQKLLVWGDRGASYHMDVYRRAKAMASRHDLTVEPLGGGRIEHYPDQKVVFIYGYSGAFGAAPHEVSAALVRKWYPLYGPQSVVVSYQGY